MKLSALLKPTTVMSDNSGKTVTTAAETGTCNNDNNSGAIIRHEIDQKYATSATSPDSIISASKTNVATMPVSAVQRSSANYPPKITFSGAAYHHQRHR